VIGDVPYGDEVQRRFAEFIAGINADPDVRTVTYLGDSKSGSTTCDDQRFAVRQDFDDFRDPLVYTPGDNEWTDCHRAKNLTDPSGYAEALARRLALPSTEALLQHAAREGLYLPPMLWR
jgi:hypothetical protein